MDVLDALDGWAALLAAQHGLATRRQILAQGITDDGIRAHLAAGRWQRVHDGVYATFTGPLPPAARRTAALLACWPCALSHRTAGEYWGMTTVAADEPVHVTVPYRASAIRDDGLVVHRSRAFAHIVVTTLDPPVVSAAQTAVDLAVAESSAREAMRTLLHCLVVTRLTPAAVRVAVESRRPRRWKRALLDAVRYAEEGVTSKLEALYALDVEEAHGFPDGVRQFAVTVDGARRDEDVIYAVGGTEVVVRLDGRRYHAEEAVNLVDRRRGNAAELAGRAHLSYGWPEVRHRPCDVAREVGAVLRARGWSGALRACERCSG